jgi:hypothetical protein
MHHSDHIDGGSVVLPQGRRGFHILASGVLTYDGETH